MSTPLTLLERRSDFTQTLLLDAAIRILERDPAVTDLTARAIAKESNISERTIFRYYATRDVLLDAVAEEAARRLNSPPVPLRIEDLPDYPRALYTRYEEKAQLTKAALHSELFGRIQETVAADRWKAVRRLIDAYAPQRSHKERKFAAANIRFFLAATPWHYYRFYFKFTLEDTIQCTRSHIVLVLDSLKGHSSNVRRKQ